MKKILSVLLCLTLLLSAVVPAFASSPQARLYNVYGDGMLFQCDADAVLAGEAPDGSEISAELYDMTGALVTSGTATATDGAFRVSFPAPAGGYDVYTVKVKCGGAVFTELKNVVFGALWLATGQSNMQYEVLNTPEGIEMQKEGRTGSPDIHVLYCPMPITDEGEWRTEYLPQTDVPNCKWFTADDPAFYYMSGVAYFFAEKLQKSLDMPVGILNAPLGATAIATWLSRRAIDGNEEAKAVLQAWGGYFGEERWSDPNRSVFNDMTNMYNINIAPLTNFRPAGAIWYQGCTNCFTPYEYYGTLFNLLQDSYTEDFGCAGGRMPFIFSQLAMFAYGRGPVAETGFNEVFTTLAKEDPAHRGEVTIYDVPLDFIKEQSAVHPMTKKPIGERMASLAGSLVYGGDSPTSAAYCSGSEIRDGSVYLTFENVGDGLRAKGDTLRGFAICGEDGIAVEADAEIVAADTVRVFSEYVPEPVAATYAVTAWSERANLWSSFGGDLYMPAASYGYYDANILHHYTDNAWMNCENLTFFGSSTVSQGYIDAWKTSCCSVSVETEDRVEGDGALRVRSVLPLFELAPAISDKDGLKTVVFDNADTNWSDYGTLRLKVKNRGKGVVRLNEIRLYTDEYSYYTPVCSETGLPGVTVPADGEWHSIVFDLNRLLRGGTGDDEKTKEELSKILRIKFRWDGANADLLLDDIRVLPEEIGQGGESVAFESFVARLRALFAAFLDMLRAFFGCGAGR